MRKPELEYLPSLEISKSYAKLFPNNCAVIERTADGLSVGPCAYYLRKDRNCPRHGTVKRETIVKKLPEK